MWGRSHQCTLQNGRELVTGSIQFRAAWQRARVKIFTPNDAHQVATYVEGLRSLLRPRARPRSLSLSRSRLYLPRTGLRLRLRVSDLPRRLLSRLRLLLRPLTPLSERVEQVHVWKYKSLSKGTEVYAAENGSLSRTYMARTPPSRVTSWRYPAYFRCWYPTRSTPLPSPGPTFIRSHRMKVEWGLGPGYVAPLRRESEVWSALRSNS